MTHSHLYTVIPNFRYIWPSLTIGLISLSGCHSLEDPKVYEEAVELVEEVAKDES